MCGSSLQSLTQCWNPLSDNQRVATQLSTEPFPGTRSSLFVSSFGYYSLFITVVMAMWNISIFVKTTSVVTPQDRQIWHGCGNSFPFSCQWIHITELQRHSLISQAEVTQVIPVCLLYAQDEFYIEAEFPLLGLLLWCLQSCHPPRMRAHGLEHTFYRMRNFYKIRTQVLEHTSTFVSFFCP